jgi:hypothetical protein
METEFGVSVCFLWHKEDSEDVIAKKNYVPPSFFGHIFSEGYPEVTS